MIDPPHLVQRAAQPAAVIRLTIPRAEIQQAMGPAISEVMAAVEAQGLTRVGAWFSHHLKMDPDVFDCEVGVPVTTPVAATGRVTPGQLPAANVAQTTFHGDYAGLGSAWAAFDAWIAANGHTAGPDLWECYVAGPEASADPATWRTELNRPLVG